MRFHKFLPQILREKISVSDVVSKRLTLIKKAEEFIALCPFHKEKTPSFTVSDQKKFYHCFGCQAHGDIIKFVIHTENLSFEEAVIALAKRYNVNSSYYSNSNDNYDNNCYSDIFPLIEKTNEIFTKNLFDYKSIDKLNYLKSRGVSLNEIKEFKLGFAGSNSLELANYCINLGYKKDILTKSGVISYSKNKKLYNIFTNRITFPINDFYGKIVGFGGRVLDSSHPKYINSYENPIFKKGELIYNYFRAKKEIIKKRYIVLVEGYMDVISLHSNGIKNVVSTLGTAVTKFQLEKMFQLIEKVIVCMDGDDAGKKAALKIMNISLPIINYKRNISFVLLPKNSDPEDFITNNGAKRFVDLLNNSLNLSELLFENTLYQVSPMNRSNVSPEKKARLESILIRSANLISDSLTKKHFLQYFKEKLFNLGKKEYSKKLSNKLTLYKFTYSKILENYAYNILAMLIFDYKKIINYNDNYGNIRNLVFHNDELSDLKEAVIEYIDKCNPTNQDLINFIKLGNFNKKTVNHLLQFLQYFNGKNIDKDIIKIMMLKYYHQKVSDEYSQSVNNLENRNEELFKYKSDLEKLILEAENRKIYQDEF